jgi:hypothetical protein
LPKNIGRVSVNRDCGLYSPAFNYMPKKKTTIKSEKEVEEKGTAKEDKKLAQTYQVYNRFGQYVREYTPEIHGERRKELAEEYIATNGGTIKEV